MDSLQMIEELKHMASANNHKGVIFDMDGVLVDTGWAHKQSWYDLAENEGFNMSDEFFYSTFGMQNYQIIPMLLRRKASLSGERECTRDEIDRLGDWKEQRYRELVADQLTLSDGAQRLLDDLKDSGFFLAVGSSAPRANLDLVLERVQVRGYFDACVAGEEVTAGKPAPDTFLKAAWKLALPPDRCVVVEDAVQGVDAAKAAGMAVVAVTTTRDRAALTRADVIVESLAELSADDFAQLLTNPD